MPCYKASVHLQYV